MGWSLGGYYAPRAAAFEKRIKLVAAWGANHNWAEVQKGRIEREGENPVPHYWAHAFWVWNASDLDDFLEKTKDMHLNGVVEQITVPFLITHGVNDRQINVKYAQQSYDQAVNSPRRTLPPVQRPRGWHRAHLARQHAVRGHLHGRLDRRNLRRTGLSMAVQLRRYQFPRRKSGADAAVVACQHSRAA